MPEEIEVETGDLQDTIDELREEREERQKEAKETRWTRFISLTTALFAVVAAIAALQAGKLVNESVIVKSEAVLQQARASDTWAYYQAKGIKSQSAAQTADLLAAVPSQAAAAKRWKSEAAKQKTGQTKLKDDATELEAKRDEKNGESAGLLERHEVFARCVTLMQVAISLSAIAALTKRKDVWIASIVLGIAGTVFFAFGFMHHPEAINTEGQKHAVSAEEKKPDTGGVKAPISKPTGEPGGG